MSQGPGPLCCLAATVSNGISRKIFLVSCTSELRGCFKISDSSVLWHLPSKLANPAFGKQPLGFLLPLVPWTDTAYNYRWDKFVEEVLLPSSAARMDLHLSLSPFFGDGDLHPPVHQSSMQL